MVDFITYIPSPLWVANFFPLISYFKNYVCDVCPQAKQARLSSHTGSISSCRPFQSIHYDICGSFFQPSISGARFSLVNVDGFWRWYNISFKIFFFFSMVQTQYQFKIENIHSSDIYFFIYNKFSYDSIELLYNKI